MDENNDKSEQISFMDISKDYLVETGEEVPKTVIKSSDIIEDEDGNCTVMGHKIEANACSMLKDDYEV